MLVSRGVWRMYAIAERDYRATLDAHAVLDFPDLLLYTLRLLGQMEEFSQSRYRLESRYHHVLVDEFQDTSRAQWELVVAAHPCVGRGRGSGAPGAARAVGVHRRRPEAVDLRVSRRRRVGAGRGRARHLPQLRPGSDVRRSISRSFRSVPALLAFVNDVCADLDKVPARTDAFVYGEDDVFPLGFARGKPLDFARDRPVEAHPAASSALGLIAGPDVEACAAATAAEIATPRRATA